TALSSIHQRPHITKAWKAFDLATGRVGANKDFRSTSSHCFFFCCGLHRSLVDGRVAAVSAGRHIDPSEEGSFEPLEKRFQHAILDAKFGDATERSCFG